MKIIYFKVIQGYFYLANNDRNLNILLLDSGYEITQQVMSETFMTVVHFFRNIYFLYVRIFNILTITKYEGFSMR